MPSAELHGPMVLNEHTVYTSTGSITLVNQTVFVLNKDSGAATAITLPSSPKRGRMVWIKDGKGDAGTNNITISAASGNIDGASSYVMRENYEAVLFFYNGTQWNVVSRAEAVTEGGSSVTISDGDGSTNLVPTEQVLGTTQALSSMLLGCFSTTDATPPMLAFLKSGNATIGSNTTVASGERLGDIVWFGADGTDFESPAAAIRGLCDTTVGTGDMPGRLVFLTTADGGETLTEALRITSAQDVRVNDGGGLIVGSTTAQVTISNGDGSTDLIPEVQILGTTKTDGSLLLMVNSATATTAACPSVNLLKSAHATLGSNTVVVSGEVLGEINAFGADGTDFESPACRIQFVVDTTPGAGDMPGRMVFLTTADSGETLTESFRVASDQNVYVVNNNGMVVGHTAQITMNALVPELQVLGTTVGVDGALAVGLYSSTASEGPEIILARSKSATLGTNTIVANNDSLGRIVAMGADGGTGFDPAAAIVFEVAGTPGAATDMPGRILFQTSPDGSQTPATRMTILSGATTVAQAQLGTAGTSTGALVLAGATSGTTTVSAGAVAGAWTMQLPAAVGAGGQQLTDAGGDGICTWAAASLGIWKNDLGILDPHEALDAVVKSPTHKFTYNKDVLPAGQWDGAGAEMTGIFAEEAPWAMHGERDGVRSGIAFSAVNAFGYARAAIQALYEDLMDTIRALPADVLAKLPANIQQKLIPAA